MMSTLTEMDSITTVLGLKQDALHTFTKMWYHVFMWAFLSSVFVHFVSFLNTNVTFNFVLYNLQIAALIAFLTLRKHKFGKFFPILILIMGFVTPVISGVVSSATIAFVYRASSFSMEPLYALFWGVGQTAVSACIGITRILATL